MNDYDVIIIGGGPAGLTAGLYASRDRFHALLIEKGFFGGLIATAELVENYPGFPQGISGFDLSQLIHQQATKYGLQTVVADVTGLQIKGAKKTVETTEGNFTARALIIATGSERSKLNVPGEADFIGRGVSYCATCDALFFKDMPVAVVGGGDAAVSEALHLAKVAAKVTVIHRRNELRATRILAEHAAGKPNLNFLLETVVERIEGDSAVNKLQLRNVKTRQGLVLEIAGVFISVGLVPNTGFVKGVLPLDDEGHIITDDGMATSVAGIFAAGDVRRNSGMQAITAAGEGATAAIRAHKYLE